MAQRVQVVLEDDIDGGEATQTIALALDGTSYEIDLNDKNAEKLREAIAPWIGHARKVTKRRSAGRSGGGSGSGSRNQTSEIRAWAQEQGMQVSARGRVSAEVREAYEKAHA